MRVAVSTVLAVSLCAGLTFAQVAQAQTGANAPTRAEAAPSAKAKVEPKPKAEARPTPRPSLAQLAADGDAVAQFDLGQAYFTGKGQPRDALAAISWWMIAAGNGSAQAALRLAEVHVTGQGLPVDLHKAALWYYRAGMLDDQTGKDRFVEMIISGQHKDVLGLVGLSWLEEAAKKDPKAAYRLIDVLAQGWGVPKDLPRAKSLALAGALKGDAEYQYRLGDMLLAEPNRYRVIYTEPHKEATNTKRWRLYENRAEAAERAGGDEIVDSTRSNMAQAELWLKRAAAQDHGPAHARLARAYLDGLDLPANLGLSIRHLQAAALSGDKDSNLVLGRLAQLGQGFFGPEPIRAYVGFEKSGQNDARDALAKTMSRGQINRAKAVAGLF